MKIDRLITILMMLINRRKVTAKELADYFEVSVRTIQRDIDTLSASGVPIFADVGKNGGYSLINDYVLHKSCLNIDEGKLLLSVLSSLDDTLPSGNIKSIYNKMINVVPKDLKEEKLIIKLNPSINYGNLKTKLKILSQGRDSQLKVQLDYTDSNLESTSRTVNPHTLILIGSIWYLFAFCNLRGDFRLFKLNRIDNVLLLDESFERFPLPAELPWDRIYDSNRENTLVLLEVDISMKDKITDYFSCKDIVLKDHKLLVSVNYPVDDWLYSFFLGMCPHIKILSPDWVRDEFIKRLKLSIEKNIL